MILILISKKPIKLQEWMMYCCIAFLIDVGMWQLLRHIEKTKQKKIVTLPKNCRRRFCVAPTYLDKCKRLDKCKEFY